MEGVSGLNEGAKFILPEVIVQRCIVYLIRNSINHMEQLFDYGSSIRKIKYTTNAVESINSSFRKVTKQGAFPDENALLKLLYLRITELYRKWDNGTGVQNWAMVRNQLSVNDNFKERISKYENNI